MLRRYSGISENIPLLCSQCNCDLNLKSESESRFGGAQRPFPLKCRTKNSGKFLKKRKENTEAGDLQQW